VNNSIAGAAAVASTRACITMITVAPRDWLTPASACPKWQPWVNGIAEGGTLHPAFNGGYHTH